MNTSKNKDTGLIWVSTNEVSTTFNLYDIRPRVYIISATEYWYIVTESTL